MVGIHSGKRLGNQALDCLLSAYPTVVIGVERHKEAVRRGLRVDLQAARRMSVTGHGALILCPFHDGGGPGGPTLRLRSIGTRIGLILQVEKADMPERLR